MSELAFLEGGGEMGARMRAHDWSTSPLGDPANWPQSLRSVVGLMINSRYPMFVAWGPELAFLYNDGYAPIFGAKHPRMLGVPFREAWPEIWDELVPLIDSALAGEATYHERLHLVMERNGFPEDTWYDFSYSPVRDESGAVAGLFCACTEVTRHVLAERSMADRDARLTAMFNQMTEGVIMADADGKLTFVNRRAKQLHGVADLMVPPERYSETYHLFTEDGRPHPFEKLPLARAVMKGEVVEEERWRIRRPDGSEVIAIGSARPIFDDSAAQIASVLTIRDDSARHEAEIALRESEERLRLVIDAASDYAIFTTDPERIVTSWSRGAELAFGYTASEIIGQCADILWTPEDQAKGQPKHEAEAARAEGCANNERWHQRQDGSRVFMNGSVHPLPANEDGSERGFIKIARDETERRAADEDLKRLNERLSLESQRLSDMFEQAPSLMAMLRGPDHVFELANPGYLRFVGSRDLIGKPIREALPDIEGQGFYELLDQAFASGEAVVGTATRVGLQRTPGGRLEDRFVDFVFQPVTDADNRVSGIFIQGTDVTERKLADDRRSALIDLGDRLRDLATPADIAFAAAEILGRTLGVSRAGYGTIDPVAETITIEKDWNAPGIESLAGVLNFRDYGSYIEDLKRGETVVFADAEQDPRTAATADALKAISAQSLVNMPITEQGGFVALLYLNHATAREWTADEIEFVRDVAERTRTASERRRAELELRERSEEFYTLADNIPALAWMAYADGSIFWYNRRWYEYTGTSADSQKGWGWESVHHPDTLTDVVERWRASIESGDPFEMTFPLRRADGEYRPFLTRIVPIRDEQGKVVRWFGTNVDVSERIEAERALTSLNETLESRVTEEIERRNAAEDALRQAQKMETIGQLTGGIAHDFNNLLQIIAGNIDMVKRGLPEDEIRLRRSADNALKGAERAAILTQRLLAFARRQPLAPKVIDPGKLVSGMAEMLHRTLGETYAIDTVTAPDVWSVEADPNQLESALLNLAVNARDAMPGGGKLSIEVANTPIDEDRAGHYRRIEPGDYVVIRVTDTGSGMDPDTAERAVEPFFTTKDVGKGTGLGLSMVYGFVRQSGGHLRIESEEGQGTTVEIHLPRHHGAEPAESAPANERAPEDSAHETILLCEDDDDVRAFSAESLQELGYRVIEASDGEAALDQLAEANGPIDLLFTDVVLPGMTGAELAERARALRPGLKILFTTGYARDAIVHQGRLDPGIELLSKPFTYTELAARIRDLLRAGGSND